MESIKNQTPQKPKHCLFSPKHSRCQRGPHAGVSSIQPVRKRVGSVYACREGWQLCIPQPYRSPVKGPKVPPSFSLSDGRNPSVRGNRYVETASINHPGVPLLFPSSLTWELPPLPPRPRAGEKQARKEETGPDWDMVIPKAMVWVGAVELVVTWGSGDGPEAETTLRMHHCSCSGESE